MASQSCTAPDFDVKEWLLSDMMESEIIESEMIESEMIEPNPPIRTVHSDGSVKYKVQLANPTQKPTQKPELSSRQQALFDEFAYIRDPSCMKRSYLTVFHYATLSLKWIASHFKSAPKTPERPYWIPNPDNDAISETDKLARRIKEMLLKKRIMDRVRGGDGGSD